MSDSDFEKKAKEALNKAGDKAREMGDNFKETKAGKSILGDDGKLGKDDLDRAGRAFAGTQAGKSILGEDGKFDKDDAERIGNSVKDAANKGINSLKDLFSKADSSEEKK